MKHAHIVPRLIAAAVLIVGAGFAVSRWGTAQDVGHAAWAVLGTSRSDASEQAATAASEKQLQSIVGTVSGTYGANIGLVVTDLSNGATAGANADAPFVSASIYKLFVAYDVYRKIDAGTVAYTDKLTSYGTSRTVGQCLDDTLTVSDNACGKALGKLSGWATLDATLAQEGYTHTVLNNYDAKGTIVKEKLTSASDVALLLTRLYAGTLLSKSSTEHFLDLLKADEITYMLPSGLPTDTTVAHKVGFLGEYQHDAGIIYGAKRDVLVVMLTKGWGSSPEAKATAAFKTLDSAVWAYMQT